MTFLRIGRVEIFLCIGEPQIWPIIKIVDNFEMTIKELQSYANELTYDGYAGRLNQKAEGVLFRPITRIFYAF